MQNQSLFINSAPTPDSNPLTALKRLRKKIKKMDEKKQAKIKRVRCQKYQLYEPIDAKMKNIISQNPTQVILKLCDFRYFEPDQLNLLKNQTQTVRAQASKNYSQNCIDLQRNNEYLECPIKGISCFWMKVFANSPYKQSLTKCDIQFFHFLEHIQIKENKELFLNGSGFSVKQEYRELSLEISICSGHRLIRQGTYKRTLLIDKKGEPLSYTGTFFGGKTTRRLRKGLCKILFEDTRDKTNLEFIQEFFETLRQQLIPYSLQYFLRDGLKANQQNEYLEVVESSSDLEQGSEKQEQKIKTFG